MQPLNLPGQDSHSSTLQKSFLISLCFAILLWLIHGGVYVFNIDQRLLAVHPGRIAGLIGVLSAPLIHSSWAHLIANTLPVLLLGSALVYGYPRSRWYALTVIWLASGLCVWLWARPNFHFGASGLTHGVFFYLFLAGILRRDKRSIVLLMISFMMYGGMLMSIFPSAPSISWESHLYGAIAGLLAAIGLYRLEPKAVEKKYSWEGEDISVVQYWSPED